MNLLINLGIINIFIIYIMGTHLHDVHYCNLGRVEELNNRISMRNRSSSTLETLIDFRPCRTRQILFPMLNCVKESNVSKIKVPKYNGYETFTPGYRGPISGYNVDRETILRGAINPLQNCIQNKYIPSSNSDLYDNSYLIPKNNNMGLQYILMENTNNFGLHNPNTCGLGNKLFNNHIRQQIKDMGK